MSTRSCLAYRTEKGWEGVYCHWDGYPTARGAQIFDILMKDFILNRGKIGVANKGEKSLQAFVDIYIKGHKGGWSAFPTECYCHSPEFVQRDGVHENVMTDKNSDALFIEWVYVIDVEKKELLVYTHGRMKGQHQNEAENGNKWMSPNYTHYLVASIDLNPDIAPPDWKKIEDAGNKISNEMYEKFKTKGE